MFTDDPEVVILKVDPETQRVVDFALTRHIVRVRREGKMLVLCLSDGNEAQVEESGIASGPYSSIIKIGE